MKLRDGIWRNPEIYKLHAEWRRLATLAITLGRVTIVILMTGGIPIALWATAYVWPWCGAALAAMAVAQWFWHRGSRCYERYKKLTELEMTADERAYVRAGEDARWN